MSKRHNAACLDIKSALNDSSVAWGEGHTNVDFGKAKFSFGTVDHDSEVVAQTKDKSTGHCRAIHHNHRGHWQLDQFGVQLAHKLRRFKDVWQAFGPVLEVEASGELFGSGSDGDKHCRAFSLLKLINDGKESEQVLLSERVVFPIQDQVVDGTIMHKTNVVDLLLVNFVEHLLQGLPSFNHIRNFQIKYLF